jgi:hypothetical protein
MWDLDHDPEHAFVTPLFTICISSDQPSPFQVAAIINRTVEECPASRIGFLFATK